jgi:hypothetical protein
MSGAEGLRSPRRIVKIALVAALAILVAGGIRAARRATDSAPLLGVELGMTADEVRARFRPPEPGFFMVGSDGSEPLLTWHPRGRGAGAPADVRFAFAGGLLVRATFRWPPGTSRDEVARQLRLERGTGEAGSPYRVGGGTAQLTHEPGRGPIVSYAPSP